MVRVIFTRDGCGRAVLWQGACGCWVHKCLLCGDVSHVDCGDEHEDHWDAFERACDEAC